MKIRIIKKREESKDCDIYTEDGVNECVESDQIDVYEEAFMMGYLA